MRTCALTLLFLSSVIAGCQPAYDVTARITGASFHFIAAPSRPRNSPDTEATVFIGGARLIVPADGLASLVFADGQRDDFLTPKGSAPFPSILRSPPSDQNAMPQVFTSELYLSQLLRALPDNLERWMHDPESARSIRASGLARQIVKQHDVAISGLLGRWWYFSGSYTLMPADRERLSAAIGAVVSVGSPPSTPRANVSDAPQSATSTASTHADPGQ